MRNHFSSIKWVNETSSLSYISWLFYGPSRISPMISSFHALLSSWINKCQTISPLKKFPLLTNLFTKLLQLHSSSTGPMPGYEHSVRTPVPSIKDGSKLRKNITKTITTEGGFYCSICVWSKITDVIIKSIFIGWLMAFNEMMPFCISSISI